MKVTIKFGDFFTWGFSVKLMSVGIFFFQSFVVFLFEEIYSFWPLIAAGIKFFNSNNIISVKFSNVIQSKYIFK